MSKNYASSTQPLPRQRAGWLARLYGWACERLYAEFAWSYDGVSWLVSLGRWGAWRRLALAYVVGDRVLEIGFGTGELLIELATQGRQVVGLELSWAMHRQVSRKLRQRGLAVPRVQAQAQSTPFAPATFDTILSTFPAPYIFDPATLAESLRLLRPAGQLVILLGVSAGPRTLHRLIPLVYSAPSTAWQAPLVQRFQQAGFTPTFVAQEAQGMIVNLIIARPTVVASP